MVKNLPVNAKEVRVLSLGKEDPLEESIATHSGGLQCMGLQRDQHDKAS